MMRQFALALAILAALVGLAVARGGMGPGPGMVHSTGGGTLSFAASATSPAWLDASNSPYTFSADIGTAAADRMVVVAVYVEGSAAQGTVPDPNGVQLGAGLLSMTRGSSSFITSATSGNFGIYIYYLLETTLSGTQNIKVTTSGIFPPTVDVQVGIITGSASVAYGTGGTRAFSASSADPQSVSAASAVPTNGVMVVAAMLDRTTTPFWTGTSSSSGDKNVQSAGRAVVALLAHGTAQTASFTGANNFGSIMAIATFGP